MQKTPPHRWCFLSWYTFIHMSHHNPTTRKHFPIVHTLAIAVVSIMLALGAYTKLVAHPDAVWLFDQLNLLAFMKAFGLVQIIIMLSLWWKPTRIIGTLIGSAYFGAGAVMMLSIGQSATTSTVLLLLTWVIHKCTWWSMWKHGYHCACNACSTGNHVLPRDPRLCDCNKEGCRCEHGSCTC